MGSCEYGNEHSGSITGGELSELFTYCTVCSSLSIGYQTLYQLHVICSRCYVGQFERTGRKLRRESRCCGALELGFTEPA
jgi:hypothetical protein